MKSGEGACWGWDCKGMLEGVWIEDVRNEKDRSWELGVHIRKGDETYLFFFIALLAQVLAASGHLGSAHGVFFGGEMLFDLRF